MCCKVKGNLTGLPFILLAALFFLIQQLIAENKLFD